MKLAEHTKISAAAREETLTALYLEMFPVVARYISKRGGNAEEARDIFQESLLLYYENELAGKDEARNPKAYITGIAKHLWFRRCHQKAKLVALPEDDFSFAEEETENPAEQKLLTFLKKAGERCMKLLRAFYYDKTRMEQLAADFGFTSVRSATVQKYKCLEKVRNEVREKNAGYADFLE